MEFALDPSSGRPSFLPLEPTRIAAACHAAIDAIDAATTPEEALGGALSVLHEELDRAFVVALAVEHDRLWHVASRGFAMTPDGLPISDGIVGRAIRSGRIQYVPDLAADPAYVEVVSGVSSEIAVPLSVDGAVIGVINLESVAPLPRQSPRLFQPLAVALGPVLAAVRNARSLDLSGLARLFVYVSTLRDPQEISEIAVASLTRVLPIETGQLYLRGADGTLELAASCRVSADAPPALSIGVVSALRDRSGHPLIIEEVDLTSTATRPGDARFAVLLPLRASGDDLGVLIGTSRWALDVKREAAEVASVLAAQAAASVDAALSLGRERRSALTDPLTGLLNRRGFELELESALAVAQETRRPLSLWVLDCDDFKEVNDRAGHEFGDALLREVGQILAAVVPPPAQPGRLGGDEFVVMLPDVDSASAERSAAEITNALAEGLKEAGFPLHLSGGVATYPFDGGSGSQLVRAADQALYEAKETGKDRIVGFRQLVREGSRSSTDRPSGAAARHGRSETAMLVEAAAGASSIAAEVTVDAVLERLCKTLTFVVGASGCFISRVVGKKLIDAVAHSLRDVDFSVGRAYLIDDFPVTKAALDAKQTRAISFLDEDLDRAEAFVLREFKMNCALLLPMVVDGESWGLVELYDVRLRRFTTEQQAISEFLVSIAARRVEALGSQSSVRRLLPLYRPPSSG